MNTTVSTPRGRQHTMAPDDVGALPQRAAPRVGPLDRLAMRVGLALLLWGRRAIVAETRRQQVQRVERELARGHRERDYERRYRMLVPTR